MNARFAILWMSAVVVTLATLGTATAGGNKGMSGKSSSGGGGNFSRSFSQKSSGISSQAMKLNAGSFQSSSNLSQKSIKNLKIGNSAINSQSYQLAPRNATLGNNVKLNGLTDKTKLHKTGPLFPVGGVIGNTSNSPVLNSDQARRVGKGLLNQPNQNLLLSDQARRLNQGLFGHNQPPIDPGIGNGNGSGKGGPFKKQPYCFPNNGCWPNYGCNYPIWWGGCYGYPNYGCGYPWYPSHPVTVSGGSTTVLVSAPAEQAVPAAVVAGTDLQLIDVRMVDGGKPAEQLGPLFRVTFRNAGTTIDRQFNVAAMAAMDDNLTPELPQTMVRVNGVKGGELTFVDVRLPVAALQMAANGGQPKVFAKLFVFVDSHQEIDDANRENNMTALDRTAIKAAQ